MTSSFLGYVIEEICYQVLYGVPFDEMATEAL